LPKPLTGTSSATPRYTRSLIASIIILLFISLFLFFFPSLFFHFHCYHRQGLEHRAQVELAPLQRGKRKARVDKRANTLDSDPDFLQFVDAMAKPVEPLPSAESWLETRAAEPPGAPVNNKKKTKQKKKEGKGKEREEFKKGKKEHRCAYFF
jgi:hypothetical protein